MGKSNLRPGGIVRMSKNEQPKGRIVRAINLQTNSQAIACELMAPYEHDGVEYQDGDYAILDGFDVTRVIDGDTFRAIYFPVCDWQIYDRGWSALENE